MTNLVSRILLAILMCPMAVILYIAILATLVRPWGRECGWLCSTVVVGSFTAVYWLALWRTSVVWTHSRKMWTGLSGVLCLGAGAIFGVCLSVISGYNDGIFVIVVDGPFAIISWLIATVLLWRETAAERAERVRQSAGDILFCSKCGYNMTGLYESQCPECGTRYTLDQLYAAQRRDGLEKTSAS